MSPPARSVTALLLMLGAGVFEATTAPAPGGASCEGPDVDPWVTRMRDRVVANDLLARFAIQRFGAPISCEGAARTEFDGNRFGFLRLGFEGGARFEIETQPPEASVATLRVPDGLDDEDDARRTLEAYCDDIGVEVDWTRPSVTRHGEERFETYRDPDDGLNASASLIFSGDTLVGLRFGLAL